MKFPEFVKNLNVFNTIAKLKTQVHSLKSGGSIRPYNDNLSQHRSIVYYRYPFPINTLYEVSYNSDVLTTVHNAIRREIFRNGIELLKAKDTDVDILTPEELVDPSEEKRVEVLKWFRCMNANQQSIKELGYEIEDDFQIIDDMFLLANKTYTFDNKGDIADFETDEFIRIYPRYMELVMNQQDIPGMDDEENYIMSCPEHRAQDIITKDENARCPLCGKVAHRVYFRHSLQPHTVNYFKDEVLHMSKYRPSKRLGFSPTVTVWMKVMSLLSGDSYIKELYEGKRPPKGMMFFNSANTDSLQKAWKQMIDRVKENPHLPGMMNITPGPNNAKKFVEFIDFMKSLDELQFTDQRNEFRSVIGGVFGVLPIFQGDVSQGGGLNNEGMQVTVTNRASEFGQSLWNEKILPWMLRQMKADGLVAKLRPSEEQDEQARLDRIKLNLEIGEKAAQLGLSAKYDSKIEKVVIKTGDIEAPAQDISFGNFGSDTTDSDSQITPPQPTTGNTTSGAPKEPDFDIKSPGTTKAIAKAKSQQPQFTGFMKVIQEEIDKFVKTFKRKPTEKELQKMAEDIQKKLTVTLNKTVDKEFKKTYLKGVESVEKDLDVNIAFGTTDKNALEVLKTQKVLTDAFKGLTTDLSNSIKGIIITAFKTPGGLSSADITKQIMQATNVADSRAETIARTETSKVSSAARRISYKKEDPEDTFKYRWIGPNDHRTTDTSKRIKAKVGKGKSWDELVKIVTEESAKDFPKFTVDKIAPVSHYSSRHTFSRTQ